MNPHTRQQLEDALAQRILIIDGAMGTMLQAHNPTAADFGGVALEYCNEKHVRDVPNLQELWPKPAPNGSIAASAGTGVSPIPRT